jgi:hypothetical protein
VKSSVLNPALVFVPPRKVKIVPAGHSRPCTRNGIGSGRILPMITSDTRVCAIRYCSRSKTSALFFTARPSKK